MDSWPASLPAPLVDGVSYESQNNTVRTQMETGAAKMRRRFTKVPEDVTFSLIVSRPERLDLDQFVTDTLKDVLPFEWTEFRYPPAHDNIAVYRFKSRPKYSPAGSGFLWRADIELELITKPAAAHFPLSNESGQTLTMSDGTVLTT